MKNSNQQDALTGILVTETQPTFVLTHCSHLKVTNLYHGYKLNAKISSKTDVVFNSQSHVGWLQ